MTNMAARPGLEGSQIAWGWPLCPGPVTPASLQAAWPMPAREQEEYTMDTGPPTVAPAERAQTWVPLNTLSWDGLLEKQLL